MPRSKELSWLFYLPLQGSVSTDRGGRIIGSKRLDIVAGVDLGLTDALAL